MVTAFCPRHGWSTNACGDDGSSSPEYTPATPPNSPTSATPPEFLLRGIMAARCGAPHFSMTAGSSSSMAPTTPPPPPPPASSIAGHPTTAAAAYVTRILVRVSDTIRIGYADTHFSKKH